MKMLTSVAVTGKIRASMMRDIGVQFHKSLWDEVRTFIIKPEGTWHIIYRFRDIIVLEGVNESS